jgi:4'-phosphopantetheinyl transferase
VEGKSLQFNLSHSNEYAVYVFGWDRAVGIDIEYVRPMEDADDFASRFFSARESELIQSLTGHRKWDAFFKLWTCKEAFLKANGSGLTFPLNQAEVHLGMGGSAKLTSIGGDSMQASRWRLETFKPFLDYQASLAVEGHDWELTFHRLDD